VVVVRMRRGVRSGRESGGGGEVGVVGYIAEGSWRGRSQKKGVGSVEE